MKSTPFSVWPILLLAISFCFLSCNSDTESPIPPNEPTPEPIEIDPELVSSFLLFHDATELEGTLPEPLDGDVFIEVEDTIYSIKGYPFGNRIRFLKDASQEIAGYYVGIPSASIYYDVPEEEVEGQYVPEGEEDTTSVLFLELNPDETIEEYPFTIPIWILPYDESGSPIKRFIRWITVEDPDDGTCTSIARPNDDYSLHWEWEFTLREYNGEVLNVFAPDIAVQINPVAGGCCTNDGRSYSVASSPYCYVGANGSNNFTYIEYPADDYSLRGYEMWQIWENGEVYVWRARALKNYIPQGSNFCTGELTYLFDYDFPKGEGTHDYVSGDQNIRFDWEVWEESWRPIGGELIHTCNSMVFLWGVDDRFAAVFRRFDADHSDQETFLPGVIYEAYWTFKKWFPY